MADGWKRKMICCLNEIFVVLISVLIFLFDSLFCSILERKDDKLFKRDIIVLISFPIFFCFNFFSGKYWKRNVPSGVPYISVYNCLLVRLDFSLNMYLLAFLGNRFLMIVLLFFIKPGYRFTKHFKPKIFISSIQIVWNL